MAEEKLFEETYAFDAADPETSPDTNFFLVEKPAFGSQPVRGQTATLTLVVNENSATDDTYYLRISVDGTEQKHLQAIPVNPTEGGMEIPVDLSIPDSSTFNVTVEGGRDGTL